MRRKRSIIRQKINRAQKHGKKVDGFYLASCYGKVRYASYEETKIFIENLIGQKPYKCKFCNYYHHGRKHE